MYWGAPNVILHMAEEHPIVFKRETLQHPFRARVSWLNFLFLSNLEKNSNGNDQLQVLRDLTELYDQKKV